MKRGKERFETVSGLEFGLCVWFLWWYNPKIIQKVDKKKNLKSIWYNIFDTKKRLYILNEPELSKFANEKILISSNRIQINGNSKNFCYTDNFNIMEYSRLHIFLWCSLCVLLALSCHENKNKMNTKKKIKRDELLQSAWIHVSCNSYQ